MNILVVGDGQSEIHEVAVSFALKKSGHNVKSFYWYPYFNSAKSLLRYWYRFQNKFIIGPTVNSLNRDLLKIALSFCPDIVFIYRGTHIKYQTLICLKKSLKSNCILLGYNNDDPFAKGHPFWLWRNFIKCIPYYDLVYAYRERNMIDYINKGAKRTDLLRSWFVEELNYPIILSKSDSLCYETEVVFVGHYENDDRLDYLSEIVRAGYKLKIFGPPYEWNSILSKSEVLRSLVPVRLVWGAEYCKAISGSKIALCFFSKLNRDTYTRRCFEIPAIGTMLLSEYSNDIATLYLQGVEADFFRSKEEMINKIKVYLENDKLRRDVALNGRQRVIQDGHDIVSRMDNVVRQVKLIMDQGIINAKNLN